MAEPNHNASAGQQPLSGQPETDRRSIWLRSIFGLLLIGALLGPLFYRPDRSALPEIVQLTGPTMGTRFSISLVVDQPGPSPEELLDRVQQRLQLLNARMSTYDPDSELSRFNASDSTDWFEVSATTAKVVDHCVKLAAKTYGAFDPTVGPLVNLWGFGPPGSQFSPPSSEQIQAAQTRIGYQKVEVRFEPPALRKTTREIYLDLSAAAKGYGVDVIAELVEQEGFANYLVEIGGEIRSAGRKPDGRVWRIGVEAPDSNGRKVQRVVEPNGKAVATSGDYRNFYEFEGIRYSHTIDPVAGAPVNHDLATVSVMAETCLAADGLATALLVLGPERGYDWAVENEVAALLISRSDEDKLSERSTPAWETLNPELD